MTVPVTALAQDCPPGAWFCEDVAPPDEAAPADLPPPGSAPAEVEEQEPVEATPPPRRRRPTTKAPPQAAPPPVVVYQPANPGGPPPQVIIVAPGAYPPPRVIVRTAPGAVPAVPPPPAPPKYRWRREWGINLRLEGVSLGRGKGAAENAGMGGIGLSLRYRPVPAFAFDVGVDVLGGIDYHGYERTEVPLSLSGMLFVNPRSKVQFYFMGGVHISHAEVDQGETVPILDETQTYVDYSPVTEYDYFGGQGGIGLEFRLSKRVALNIDALAFIRNRTDDGTVPEFRDPENGRTTDTSAGGLFRGGISFYW